MCSEPGRMSVRELYNIYIREHEDVKIIQTKLDIGKRLFLVKSCVNLSN